MPCANITKNRHAGRAARERYVKSTEDNLHMLRERLESAFRTVYRETRGKLNPRDHYGKLVVWTFDAVKNCEQRAESARKAHESREQREERARLLVEFKREDDKKLAKDAEKQAEYEDDLRRRYNKKIMRDRAIAAQSPEYRDSKLTGVFEEMFGEWGG
jgi:hypothetical protein